MQILTESQIEQDCRIYAKEQGCILLKIQANKGWPDRILLTSNGKAMFMEFKRPTGRLHPLQEHIINQLREMNFQAEVIRDKETFKKHLHALTGRVM